MNSQKNYKKKKTERLTKRKELGLTQLSENEIFPIHVKTYQNLIHFFDLELANWLVSKTVSFLNKNNFEYPNNFIFYESGNLAQKKEFENLKLSTGMGMGFHQFSLTHKSYRNFVVSFEHGD